MTCVQNSSKKKKTTNKKITKNKPAPLHSTPLHNKTKTLANPNLGVST